MIQMDKELVALLKQIRENSDFKVGRVVLHVLFIIDETEIYFMKWKKTTNVFSYI